jgi:hypothetical protein
MIRALAVLLLSTGLSACQPTLDLAEQAALSCDAKMPLLVTWDGQPLPHPQSGSLSVFRYDSPFEDGHTWAIVLDGDQAVARFDIHPTAMAAFGTVFAAICFPVMAATHLRVNAQADIKCKLGPSKTPTTSGPVLRELLSSSAYFTVLENSVDATEDFVTQEFLNGQICPPLP